MDKIIEFPAISERQKSLASLRNCRSLIKISQNPAFLRKIALELSVELETFLESDQIQRARPDKP